MNRSGAKSDERVLVTVLTKRMAEDLTEYFSEHGIKVRQPLSLIEVTGMAPLAEELDQIIMDEVNVKAIKYGQDGELAVALNQFLFQQGRAVGSFRIAQLVQSAIREVTGLETELSTTGGTSDGRFISKICPQVIEFGPINASIHKVDEHVAVAAVLRSLSMMIERGPGDEPERFFDVLRAMLFYIDEFPERLHHTKESELLFPPLRERSPALLETLDRLERDHVKGEAAVREPRRSAVGLLFEAFGKAALDLRA